MFRKSLFYPFSFVFTRNQAPRPSPLEPPRLGDLFCGILVDSGALGGLFVGKPFLL